MERFLMGCRGVRVRIGVAVLSLLFLALPIVRMGTAYASGPFTAKFTGYAYGNKIGGSGYEVVQGDFANHSPSDCPNDPAAQWGFGTTIQMNSPSSISLYDGSGNATQYTDFNLEDLGDPQCAEGNYWVDIYFGRNATASEYNGGCACSGSPSPGYCLSTSHSNCQDAGNFGNPSDTYSAPGK